MQLKDQPNYVAQAVHSMKLLTSTIVVGVMLTSAISTQVNAQVLLNADQGFFSLENRSAADLLDVSRGERTIGRLASGETWSTDEQPSLDLMDKELPLKVNGRIKLEQWGDALNQLPGNRIWARLQLETAGVDINRGLSMDSLLGAQRLSKTIGALRRTSKNVGASWIEAGPLTPLKAALLAYASRYASADVLLDKLLPSITPTVYGTMDNQNINAKNGRLEQPAWPEGYELLPDPRSTIRTAIELQGLPALPAVLKSEAWSKDRGFSDLQIAFALLPETVVIQSLIARGDEREARYFQTRFAEEKSLCDEKGALAAEISIKKMIQSRTDGDVDGAIAHATSAALLWHRQNISPEESQASKIVCSYIDMGAQRTINEKLLLAARAYLNLGQVVCFGHPFYRSRAAEFMRTRGDLSFFDFDLEASIHWYRGAVLMNDELIDKVRLIDTLARLAIVEITRGNTTLANAYLREARSQETPQVPPRELLVLADDLMPIPDHRARVGMIFLIVLLGIGAFSQILRVIFSGKKK